ncbi:MAG: extracellular solute-binding protein, partial [Pseudomonadales bacterium]
MIKKILLCASLFASTLSAAQSATTATSVALRGEPKYADGFKHWDYVNPNAPKGGYLTTASIATFDNFNRYAQRGRAAPGATSFYDTIMVGNSDEDSSYYCLLCSTLSYSDDYSWVSFKVNPDARFSDGKPVRAADIAFTFEKFMTQGVNQFAKTFKGVTTELIGEDEVKFNLPKKDKDFMLSLVDLPVFPEHYWKDKDLADPLIEPPIGSGAYKVADFQMGQYIVYERRKDYWGLTHPTKVGLLNFDFERTDIYKDTTVMLEAFKKGEFDLRRESDSKLWATSYKGKNFDANYIKTEEIAHQNPQSMRGFIFNTTRDIFKDRRVREALGLMFDFEWTNKSLFYSADTRSYSYLQNSDYMARGLPEGRELEILEPYRSTLPQAVFDKEYNPPKTDGSGRLRREIRQAIGLMKKAGYSLKGGKMLDANGKQFSFEIMLWRATDERYVIPFKNNLAKIGIDMEIRTVDIAQATNRLRERNYDMMIHSMGGGVHPSNAFKYYFHSKFIDSTYNSTGYTSELTDTLIDNIMANQQNIPELKAYGKALDRVLLWQYLVIPQWHNSNYRVAYWDKFDRPATLPRYALGTNTWWYDAEKAAKLPKRNALN